MCPISRGQVAAKQLDRNEFMAEELGDRLILSWRIVVQIWGRYIWGYAGVIWRGSVPAWLEQMVEVPPDVGFWSFRRTA